MVIGSDNLNENFQKDYALIKDVFGDRLENLLVIPGLCDVHVHFREPGFEYKETIETGSKAAARGGFTQVCTMPNLKPVPDSLKNLQPQLEKIKENSKISVYPLGSISKEQKGKELACFEELAPFVCGYSDDGRGVQSKELMKKAMQEAVRLNKVIVAHCEDNSLLMPGGVIHDGVFAKTNGLNGISSAGEYSHILRDIELLRETGAKYHVCHVSAKESVEAVRQAKKEGLDITCETAPHYLFFEDAALKNEGRFKMNPPIRSKEDRLALIEGIKDGTVDMIATDHAPHGREEKSKGLVGSVFGIVGLETSFPVMYSYFVKSGIITLEKLLELMVYNPIKRFDLSHNTGFSVWDVENPYCIDSSEFLSKGKATPFEGVRVFGKSLLTVYNGEIVYKSEEF